MENKNLKIENKEEVKETKKEEVRDFRKEYILTKKGEKAEFETMLKSKKEYGKIVSYLSVHLFDEEGGYDKEVSLEDDTLYLLKMQGPNLRLKAKLIGGEITNNEKRPEFNGKKFVRFSIAIDDVVNISDFPSFVENRLLLQAGLIEEFTK